MRKIRLSDIDGALFDEEMIPVEHEYLGKHKDTFRRMWIEQGKTFWERYVKVFRSYILRYSLLGDLTCDASQIQNILDSAFDVISRYFVDGKASQAWQLLNQIADLGKNRSRFNHLDSKSVRKDPFYTKVTRSIFREFFGPAYEKSSYVKAYILTPVYMKFGGSIVRCLIRWIDAEEIDPGDDSYYIPPLPIEVHTPLCPKHVQSVSSTLSKAALDNVLCAYHLEECKTKFLDQYVKGVPSYPVNLGFWEKKDPRFCEPENPLWNPNADCKSDWRDNLTVEKFQEFYAWCIFNDLIVKPEGQCPDCHDRKKSKKKSKKKKKKAAACCADSACGNVSISFDSRENLKEVKGDQKTKMSAVGKVCEGGRNCLHEGPASDSDVEECVTEALRFFNEESTAETLQILKEVESSSMIGLFGDMDLDDLPVISPVKLLESENGKVTERESQGQTEELEGSVVDEGGQDVHLSKVLFGKKAVVKKTREALKVPVYGGVGFIRAYFEVLHKSDPETGAEENSITLIDVIVLSDNEEICGLAACHLSVLDNHNFPQLTIQFLSLSMREVPVTYCSEGKDWYVIEIHDKNYERPKKSTHFVLKISNAPNTLVMRTLAMELLRYIALRKRCTSTSWVLSVHDLFVFFQHLSNDSHRVKGVTITVVTGGTGIDVLTPEMLKTVITPEPVDIASGYFDAGNKTKKKKKKTKSKSRGQAIDEIDVLELVSAIQRLESQSSLPKQKCTSAAERSQPQFAVPEPQRMSMIDCCKSHSSVKESLPVSNVRGSESQHSVPNPVPLTVAEGLESQRSVAEAVPISTNEGSKSQTSVAEAVPVSTNEGSKSQTSVAEAVPVSTTEASKSLSSVAEPVPGSATEGLESQQPVAELTAVSASGGSKLVSGGGDASQASSGGRSLSVCSNCGEVEPALRCFKKCQKCKEQGMVNARYYCGRPCQQAHWKSIHCKEHAQQTLQ